MSRRKRRPGPTPGATGGEAPERSGRGAADAGAAGQAARGAAPGRPAARGAAPGRPAARSAGAPDRASGTGRRLAIDVAILAAVFAVTAGIAGLAGAANLGVALGVGQVAFAIALVLVLLRG